jgi:hypothetical protein
MAQPRFTSRPSANRMMLRPFASVYLHKKTMLRIRDVYSGSECFHPRSTPKNLRYYSVADPDPVPLAPGSERGKKSGSGDPGWVKNQDPESGMNNPDHISESS